MTPELGQHAMQKRAHRETKALTDIDIGAIESACERLAEAMVVLDGASDDDLSTFEKLVGSEGAFE